MLQDPLGSENERKRICPKCGSPLRWISDYDAYWCDKCEEYPLKNVLRCPLCQSMNFKKEEGKIDSKWGFTAHKVRIMICENCKFIMFFSKGRTIWDFD